MTKKETRDYEAELIREYEHWEYMKEYGGSDPFYDDAGNMNLTRNHIIHAKKQLEELYGGDMSNTRRFISGSFLRLRKMGIWHKPPKSVTGRRKCLTPIFRTQISSSFYATGKCLERRKQSKSALTTYSDMPAGLQEL